MLVDIFDPSEHYYKDDCILVQDEWKCTENNTKEEEEEVEVDYQVNDDEDEFCDFDNNDDYGYDDYYEDEEPMIIMEISFILSSSSLSRRPSTASSSSSSSSSTISSISFEDNYCSTTNKSKLTIKNGSADDDDDDIEIENPEGTSVSTTIEETHTLLPPVQVTNEKKIIDRSTFLSHSHQLPVVHVVDRNEYCGASDRREMWRTNVCKSSFPSNRTNLDLERTFNKKSWYTSFLSTQRQRGNNGTGSILHSNTKHPNNTTTCNDHSEGTSTTFVNTSTKTKNCNEHVIITRDSIYHYDEEDNYNYRLEEDNNNNNNNNDNYDKRYSYERQIHNRPDWNDDEEDVYDIEGDVLRSIPSYHYNYHHYHRQSFCSKVWSLVFFQ